MSKTLARNKKVFFNYEIIDEIEVGVVLTGGEVKSIKEGNINLKESYVKLVGESLFLINSNVSKWKGDTESDYDPTRTRKLLLKKKELATLFLRVAQEGFSIVPLSVYLKSSLIKLKIGIGKGRKIEGKKRHLQEEDQKLDMKRELKDN